MRLGLEALDGFLNNRFGFVDTLETFDFGGAWFFEVLVVVEVVFDLLERLLGQIFERFVGIAIVAVIFGDTDDLVVDFIAVDEFHDAEDFGLHPDAGSERLVGNHEDVKLVAVFV